MQRQPVGPLTAAMHAHAKFLTRPQPKRHRLAAAIKKARRATAQGQFERLLVERARWLRNQTIARNKLAGVDRKLAEFCKAWRSRSMASTKKVRRANET